MNKYLCIVQDAKRGHAETLLTVALPELTLRNVVQLIAMQECDSRPARAIQNDAARYEFNEIKGGVLSISPEHGAFKDRYDTYPFSYRYLIVRIPE